MCLALFYCKKPCIVVKYGELNMKRKVSKRRRSALVKRETGASPVRTRHRNCGVYANMPLVTREGGINADVSVGRPAFRCTRGISPGHE